MELNLAELTALSLEAAQAFLTKGGFQVEITETKPPGKAAGQGQKRVIWGRRLSERLIQLIVTYENYQ